jgi:hypothetical protein
MKRHCGLVISIIAGVFGCVWIGQTQPGAAAPPPATLAMPAPISTQQTLDNYLKFDADQKTVTVTNGAPEAHFSFAVTNISSEDVLISSIVGSCHCTVAQMPSMPWKLAPKEHG